MPRDAAMQESAVGSAAAHCLRWTAAAAFPTGRLSLVDSGSLRLNRTVYKSLKVVF